jgi:hypothetical protein
MSPKRREKRKHPRPGLHARLRRVSGLTPRSVLREPLILPVVMGQEFAVEEEALWEEFDTVSAGRFAQPAAGKHGEALRTVNLESLTMTWDPGWLTNPGENPERVIKALKKVLRKRAVFDFLVVQKAPGIGFADFAGHASLRRLALVAPRGEADTRYIRMDISGHRRISANRRRHGRAEELPTTHQLAIHYYGTGEQWRVIAKANGIERWGSETPIVQMGRYKVGDRIKIPEPPPRRNTTITPHPRGTQVVEVGD